jgi:23S rRNA (uracil1939-C5)-methyltransferase
MAALEQLATEAGISLDTPVVGDPIGHRHRARLMVRGRWRSPKIGLFQEGTHKIVDTPRCHIHHPAINRAAAALKRAIRATRTPPYADRPHTGLVRALQVVVGRDPPGLQIVVVMNDRTPGFG